MQLSELKTQALRYVVLGDLQRAFRIYETVIRAVPGDLDARMKVADLCAAAGFTALAKRVYAAVTFYDLKTGRPLHATVVAQALKELGEPIAPFHKSISDMYCATSPVLARHKGEGARLAPPDPATDVPPPDLIHLADVASAAHTAAEVASSTKTLGELPERYPPLPLLSDLDAESFRGVLACVTVRRLPHGTLIVREGEPGESFFLVASGNLRVFSTDTLGKQTELARLGEGAVFGELALVAAQPRHASVEVVGEADVLELGRKALAAASEHLAALAQALDRFTRDRLLRNLLVTSPLFRPFTPQQRHDLVKRFTAHDTSPGTDVIRQGDAGRGLYVVLSGELEVLTGEEPFETTVATLRGGDVFGEISLLRGTPATATVRSARRSTVLFLAREYFERLVAALPQMRTFFEQLTDERLKQLHAEPAGAKAVDGAEGIEDDSRVLV